MIIEITIEPNDYEELHGMFHEAYKDNGQNNCVSLSGTFRFENFEYGVEYDISDYFSKKTYSNSSGLKTRCSLRLVGDKININNNNMETQCDRVNRLKRERDIS